MKTNRDRWLEAGILFSKKWAFNNNDDALLNFVHEETGVPLSLLEAVYHNSSYTGTTEYSELNDLIAAYVGQP